MGTPNQDLADRWKMKMSEIAPTPQRGHVCLVAKDLEEMRKNWKDYLGITLGPTSVLEGPCSLRGKDVGYCKVLIAFADLGDLKVEFIQPVEGKTQEFELVARQVNGIHHLDPNFPRLRTMDERIKQWENRGMRALQIDEPNRWAYMDTERLLGAIIELH